MLQITHLPTFVATIFLVAAGAGCGQEQTASVRSRLETLDATLAPSAFAAAVRKAGGAHFHAMTSLRVDSSSKPSPGSKPASPSAITTTTDLWIDKRGNFRLVENNDQDGGREIVRVGGEVAVALRYSKMLRRPAQDAENALFVAEALGAPWAAWEIMRRQVAVEEAAPGIYRFKLGKRLAKLPAGFPAAEGLRKWRDTVEVSRLEGQATLESGSQVPVFFTSKTAFRAVRDQLPVEGEVAVTAIVNQVGKVADIVMPEAETLHVRQRTVLEERALLGGLSASPTAKKLAP